MSISYTADQLQKKFQGAPGASGFARIAETLREEGRHEEAVALCQEGLRQHPRNLTGRLVLGKCFIDMDRLEEARELLEGALRQDPRCLSAMHLLAGIMTKLQWGEAAAAYYRSILELEPWDTGSLARFRELSPAGAAGMAPAAPATPPFQTLEALTAAAPSGPEVEEFDLNEVTAFPSDENTSGDLAGALEEVSLEDALAAPAAESRAFAPAPSMPAPEEPRPLDILTTEAAPMAEPDAGEPPPISGDDVGDRLDSLFGTEDDKPLAAPLDPAAGPVDEDLMDATLQLKALRDQEPPRASDPGSATAFTEPAADFAWASADAAARGPGVGDARPEAGIPQDAASAMESPAFAAADTLPPEERVSGEDIEARLDDLFSLHDTSTQPVMKAIPDEVPAADHVPPAPEAVGTWSGAAPADSAPEVSDAEAPAAGDPGPYAEAAVPAGEDAFLPAGSLETAPALAEDDLVTGQDVADKLEALFGEESPRPETPSRHAEEPDAPTSGSASWAAARPAADDAGPAAPAEDAGSEPDLPEAGAREVSAPALPADAAPAWDEDLESSQPPAADLMTTESMLPRGLEMDPGPPITGEDIEARLDSLFDLADEGSRSGAVPRVGEPDPAPARDGVTFQIPGGVSPADPAPAAGFGDADRTMMMPAVKETAFDWLARQAGEPGAETGPAEPTREPEAAAPDAGDTLFIRNEEIFAQAPGPLPSGATDTVGLEMVDGADIADRLDQIFAAEGSYPRGEDAPAAAAKAAAEAALARGEGASDDLPVFPEPEAAAPMDEPVLPGTASEGLETGSELEVEVPLDEVALFAQDPGATLPPADDAFLESPGTGDGSGGTVISGDDIKARLSEIFDAPAGPDIRPMEDEEPETPLFLANPEAAPAGTAAQGGEDDLLPPVADVRTPAADAGTRVPETGIAAAPSLAPLMDDEEGSPEEEENAPQSAAGANVATVTLAEIYFQQGLREQALQIYRQLLEREPGNDSVRKRIQEIEASKPEAGIGPGSDPRRPRPGLKVPKRKK